MLSSCFKIPGGTLIVTFLDSSLIAMLIVDMIFLHKDTHTWYLKYSSNALTMELNLFLDIEVYTPYPVL